MFNRLVSIFNKEQAATETISESTISLHNQALAELKVLTPIANALDNANLSDPDLMFYVRLKSYFAKGIDRYKDLGNCAELLRVAIQAKDSFLKIEQTELRYFSGKQQQFYKFVFGLLEENFGKENESNLSQNSFIKDKPQRKYSAEEFKTKIQEKRDQIIPSIKTEEGKQALYDYTQSLENLAAEKELGLNLLYLFKKLELTDFSTIRVISDMVIYLQDKNMNNMPAMLDLVDNNSEIFEQIGNIIGIPKAKITRETFAILLQYIALSKKHEVTYVQFARLIEILKEWQKFYESLMRIRQEYPANKYKIPEEFTKEIPGIKTYEKYQDYVNLF